MEDWIITLISSSSSAIIAVFIAIFSVNRYQRKKDQKEARLSTLSALKDTIKKSNELFQIWFEWWENTIGKKVILTPVLEKLEEKMKQIFIQLNASWDYFMSFFQIQCSMNEDEKKLIKQINDSIQKLKPLIYSSTNEKIGVLSSYNEARDSIKEGLESLLKNIPFLKLKKRIKKKNES